MASKLRLLVLIHCADKLLIAYTVWTWSMSRPTPKKTSFIFMTTSTLHSWLIHLILGRRSVNLLLPLWRAVREPGMWKECQLRDLQKKPRKTYSHPNTPLLLQSKIFGLVPEPKSHSGAADGWQTPTVVHSHTHTARPKKIGLSRKQAIEVLTIMILFFTGEDREREPERRTHTESQIRESAESMCCLIPSEGFKGFLICVESRTAHTEEQIKFSWEGKHQSFNMSVTARFIRETGITELWFV